jgi:cytoskeleton protein RodZ
MSEDLQEQPQISPGLLLKSAREALNLSTQNIADKVHLKNSLIQDIETDTYDQNISLTFIKGYLKLYAKQVGVKEEAVIDAFDKLKMQKKEPAKLQSFSKRLAHQAHDDKLMIVTYLIVGLVIALVVIWWFQQSDSASPVGVTSTSANTSLTKNIEIDLQTPVDSDILPPEGSFEPQTDAVDQSLIAESNNVTESPNELMGQEALSEFELSPSRQPRLAQESQSLEPVELVFTFKSDCWMKLTDGTGEDVAYGTKVKDRVMAVSGVPPFSVILCSPEAAEINYAGEFVDLSGFRAGITAKFILPFTE